VVYTFVLWRRIAGGTNRRWVLCRLGMGIGCSAAVPGAGAGISGAGAGISGTSHITPPPGGVCCVHHVGVTNVGCRSSGHPSTSANVCCRYGWLDGWNVWICSLFIVWSGSPRSHLHPQFLFYPVSIRCCRKFPHPLSSSWRYLSLPRRNQTCCLQSEYLRHVLPFD
jgi:hypothetical protein